MIDGIFSVELEERPANVVEIELETKIMEELDEYVTVDAIHDECLNAALSFGKFNKWVTYCRSYRIIKGHFLSPLRCIRFRECHI